MVKQTQKLFSTSLSAEALFDNVIDYAGIFPPSELPLDEAINNYAEYINGRDAWMLGPFVFPASRLKELDRYMHLFNPEKPLAISALIRKAQNPEEMIDFVVEDLEAILKFRTAYPKKTNIPVLELPLPAADVPQAALEQVVSLLEKHELTGYCEIPVQAGAAPEEMEACIRNISKANNEKNQLRAKLRTGSVKRELIPSLGVVSDFIYSCKNNRVSMKFTAGLHHPIRMHREEVGGKMHGFLNIFAAGLFAFHHDLCREKILNILSDENHKNFSVQKETFAWDDLEISAAAMGTLRETYICSFGSCNFVGPISEFLELDIIEGGS